MVQLAVNYLNSMLLNEDYDNNEKITASKYLILLNCDSGLEYYLSYVKDHKSIPNDGPFDTATSAIGLLKDISKLNYIILLLQISYEIKFKDSDFDGLRLNVENAIINIGVQSTGNYKKISKAIREFVIEFDNIYANVNFLNLTLDKLDSQFYNYHNENLSINAVKNLIANL